MLSSPRSAISPRLVTLPHADENVGNQKSHSDIQDSSVEGLTLMEEVFGGNASAEEVEQEQQDPLASPAQVLIWAFDLQLLLRSRLDWIV